MKINNINTPNTYYMLWTDLSALDASILILTQSPKETEVLLLP